MSAEEDNGLSLASFRPTHYVVHSETGHIMVPRPDAPADEQLPAGFERVTKAELFERWPVWKREYDRLQQRLADQGVG